MKYRLPEPITYSLNNEQNEFMLEMSRDIHACPRRNRQGRAYDTVLNNVRSGLILEFALELQGAIKNPKRFDYTDPDSYDWDVDWDGLTEIKRMADCRQFPKNRRSHWITFAPYKVETYVRNITREPGKVDKIIFGVYNEIMPNTFDVDWRLVAPSDTFKQNTRRCNPEYKNNWCEETGKLKYFYSHKTESRAVYNYDIYKEVTYV